MGKSLSFKRVTPIQATSAGGWPTSIKSIDLRQGGRGKSSAGQRQSETKPAKKAKSG
jgi:hypothetical protein